MNFLKKDNKKFDQNFRNILLENFLKKFNKFTNKFNKLTNKFFEFF